MADEPQTPVRSPSAEGTRKTKAKSVAATVESTPESAAEAPAPASASAPNPAAEPRAATTAQPAHPPAAAVSGGSNGVALAGLLAGVVGIVLALTYPQWTPIVYGSGSNNRVTAGQVQAEAKAEIASLRATIAALNEKQTTLEQAVRTAKLPGVLMVAEDLRAALGGSEPYAGTLNLFRALAGDDEAAVPIIAAVEARAEAGVPSVEDLRDRFDDAAHAVLVAEQRPQASGNLASQVSDTVANLAAATMRLRWRLDGAPDDDSVGATVARAEQAVLNGDLQGAVDTLASLPEPRAVLVQPWIQLVQARLAAEAVRQDLDAYIITTASRIQ